MNQMPQQFQQPLQQPQPQSQQLHSEPPLSQAIKQNEFENKSNVANNQSFFSTDENIDSILNSLIVPDTRIFASFLSKDFNNNKNIIPNLTFPEPTHTTNPLNELAYKTLIIGNNEHIILDNPNNLSDFRGSYEKLKNVAIALANKLNKPVSVPAFLLIESEEALEDVRESLIQKQINPIIIETTNNLNQSVNNTNETVQKTKAVPKSCTASAPKKRAAKPKVDDQSNLNGQQAGPPAKKRASNKKSQQNNIIATFNTENNQTLNVSATQNTPCLNTSSSSTSFDVNQKLEQIKRENNLVYATVNSETNAHVESIINNIKSSLIASQSQIQMNSNANNQYNQVNSNSQIISNSDINNINNKNISINQLSSNNNEVDLNCYSLDSNSLFNLNLNNIEWIA